MVDRQEKNFQEQMHEVIKQSESASVQEVLAKGLLCHELCFVPQGIRLTRNKDLPSRLYCLGRKTKGAQTVTVQRHTGDKGGNLQGM